MSQTLIPSPRYYLHSGVASTRLFEDRPEFGELCRWWRGGGRGVCALVGIGGAGKTAISSRFLQILPQVTEETRFIKQDRSLRPPGAIFSFSFSDRPDPIYFFRTLENWLQPSSAQDVTQEPSFFRTVQLLGRVRSLLIIIDGLEAIQELGFEEGSRGRIVDPSVRDFIDRISDGLLRGVSAIVSTRIPISDLEEQEAVNYVRLDVDSMPEEAAVRLLRRYGVKGNDDRLLRIVNEECGAHALTVDLLGAYIQEFGEPDLSPSRLASEKKEELIAKRARESSPRKRGIINKEIQFLELTERYREAFARHDPLSLWLLERICLFRLPVPIEIIGDIFSEIPAASRDVSSPVILSGEIRRKVLSLCELRLVQGWPGKEAYGYRSGPERLDVYSVHLAVRAGFLQGLSRAEARDANGQISNYLLEELKSADREVLPRDPAMLDLLTEAIYHTVEAGEIEEAWRIHIEMVGGYANLGRRLGAFAQGERICRVFEPPEAGVPPETVQLPEDARLLWLYDRGRYLAGLGRLDDAMLALSQHNRRRAEQGNWLYASLGALQCCELSIARGRLSEALKYIAEAINLAERTASAGFWRDCHAYRAQVKYLTGDVDGSTEDFSVGIPIVPRGLDYRLPIEWKAVFLARSGEVAESERLIEAKRVVASGKGDERSVHPCVLAAMEVALLKDNNYPLPELLEPTRQWAIANDAKETLCYGAVLRARCLLGRAEGMNESPQERQPLVTEALGFLERALRITRQCGFGLLYVDLLNCRAWSRLLRGDAAGAERDCRMALFGVKSWKPGKDLDSVEVVDETESAETRGVFPPPDSGWPAMLAAAHPDCGYVRGEALGRRFLGDAILLGTARAKAAASGPVAELEAKIVLAKGYYEAAQVSALRLRDRVEERVIGVRLTGVTEGHLTPYPLTESEEPEYEALGEERKTMPDLVFMCYAHEDERWREELQEHLAPFVRSDQASLWSDIMIGVGAEWRGEIAQALERAQVAVLLVTHHFLASEFIMNDELPLILRAARDRNLRVVWIPVGASSYDQMELSRLQAAHPPDRPLDTLSPARRRQAFVRIAKVIAAAMEGKHA